ncbi:Gamma-glutamyl hydrolase A [Orchesella cincta]|uniref:folate gamma-glutamyl hydrolase n=1 Tax=Orchesella cincta TaxID=48709 RepID=A0A1D2NLN2_ORCCI|nr:Gamma-glutamyl hydrolase A [Orchesella cincta]
MAGCIQESKFTLTLILAIYFCQCNSIVNALQTRFVLNDRPIIGILSQEVYNKSDYSIPPTRAYIAASYVKYVEGAGARVVPILVDQDEDYLRKMFNSINALFFPGGAITFEYDNSTINNSSKGFVSSGLFLMKLAKEANDKGDYFPVWGTCLGFEFMLFAEGNGQDARTLCQANNQVDKLSFQKDAMQSRLFGKARKSVINTLGTKAVTANFHHFCLTPENFTRFGLNQSYRLLSTSYDPVGNVTYVSAVESKKYPFFAVQFHPEKNIYEWTLKENLPHSPEAIEVAQYFAMFFVDQARKNIHSFNSRSEEEAQLIYNYIPTYTGLTGDTFEQKYYFPEMFMKLWRVEKKRMEAGCETNISDGTYYPDIQNIWVFNQIGSSAKEKGRVPVFKDINMERRAKFTIKLLIMSGSTTNSSSIEFESAEEGTESGTEADTVSSTSMATTEEDVFETSDCDQAGEDMEVDLGGHTSATGSASLSITASTNKEDEDGLWAKLPNGTKDLCERTTGMLYMERYETFMYNNWPYDLKHGDICHPRELAVAGLSFHSLEPTPSAQCQVCLTILTDLQPDSDPWELHADASPGCYLITLGKRQGVDEYTIDELMGMALNRIISETTKAVKKKENDLKKRLFQLRNKELQQEAKQLV